MDAALRQKCATIAIGKHYIKQDQIVAGIRKASARMGQIWGVIDRMTVQDQTFDHRFGQFLVILYKQIAHWARGLSLTIPQTGGLMFSSCVSGSCQLSVVG
jgi:hypothetical protein